MPIRNPFARRPGAPANPADNASDGGSAVVDVAHPGFERVDTVGSRASISSGLSIRSRRSQDTGEYKMSVVNDSGIYLPPSPVEREAVWPRRYLSLSRASSDTKSSSQGEIEHFSISRESFDSYRRSFDISAKTPITDVAPRQSLDSHNSARFPRGHHNSHHHHLPQRSSLLKQQQEELRRLEQQQREREREREPATPDERGGGGEFEDVGLNDDGKQVPTTSKRRGFFSKFGTTDAVTTNNTTTPVQHHDSATATTTQTMSRFLGGGGRKRGQSGQGAELGFMPASRPGTATSASLQAQEVQS